MSKAGSQERFRTLLTQAHDAKNNIFLLVDHFGMLCEQTPVNGEAIDHRKVPKCKLFDLHDYFKKSGDYWVFSGEIIGTFYVLACALNSFCSHLEAFKADSASTYKLDALPHIRVLSEAEALVPADAADEIKTTERTLRDQCVLQVIGPLVRADVFTSQIQTFIKEADATFASKGGVPENVKNYIKDMEGSCARQRKEINLELRDRCNVLRSTILLQLGDAVFGELYARCLQEMLKLVKEVNDKKARVWKELDIKRADHEKRLAPRLSNPNAEKELQSLIEEEAARYKAALTQITEDRATVVACLRKQADLFVVRIAAAFEATVRLLDAVPFPAHFSPLPGDELVEPMRMSIKRRMRRLQKGQTCNEYGGNLVPRNWEGIRRYELREMLKASEWPKDVELADASPEKLAELTSTVVSFRSPAHKKLFERRNFYYDEYKADFFSQVTNRASELSAREKKEEAGQTNWKAMVMQLNPEAIIPDVQLEEKVEEEAPPQPVETKEKPKAKAKK